MFQLADVIDFAEVGTKNVSRPTRDFHCALRFQKGVAASAHQNDFGARARVGESERAPNPLAGAGDDRQAAVETNRGQFVAFKLAGHLEGYLVRPVVISRGWRSFTSRSSNG